MDFSEEHIALFDSYIKGALAAEETADFEKRLQEEEAFRQDFEEYKVLAANVQQYGITQLQKDIASWEKKASKKSPFKWWYAAAVLIIGLSGLTWVLLNSGEGNEAIFAAYYKPYPDIVTERGDGTDQWLEGMALYNNGSYEEAIKIFEPAIRDNGDSKPIQFYLALSHISSGHPKKSIHYHEPLILTDHYLADAANWYLGLSYVATGDIKKASEIFETLKDNTSSSYRKQSHEILTKLKN